MDAVLVQEPSILSMIGISIMCVTINLNDQSGC
jgi:hypothetical protein